MVIQMASQHGGGSDQLVSDHYYGPSGLDPAFWGIASAHGLYTAGDYLEYRYGSSVRATIAVLLWVLTLIILAAQLIAMSQILEWVLGAPRWEELLLVAL
ncbi:MAG: hypothetical protein Ct9H300mP15_14280 [Gemmatimonadota bacterium]|nr:MAG: hypothetical protein Ct9H300mP15_14280 [Gemmatimonadota bacterium]